LQATTQNGLIEKASRKSIYEAAMTAAVLRLSVSPTLGHAYIVPYGDEAQFQIGYKGLIQLALRTGEMKNCGVAEVREGQLINFNPLDGSDFDFNIKGGDVIGYVAKFTLLNGFSSQLYMTNDQIESHALAYSKTYARNKGPWVTNRKAMSKKTALKLLLSRYAPMSLGDSNRIAMAIQADQAVVVDAKTQQYEYWDNKPVKDVAQTAQPVRPADTSPEKQTVELPQL
jgi:recombination protein RecT